MKSKFTPNFEHPVLASVGELDLLRPNNFVINHSAALAVFGLLEREPNDIDASSDLRNIRDLRRRLGFEIVRRIVGYREDGTPIEILSSTDAAGKFDIHRWDFSMKRWRETGKGRVYLHEQKEYAVQDPNSGLWVSTPEYVIETKEQTDRDKDQLDIDAYYRLTQN